MWQHLVCKYDGSEIKFYLNGGASTDSGPASTFTINDFTDMNVGIIGGPSSQRPWDGRLDELAIWTTALSDETIASYIRYNKQSWQGSWLKWNTWRRTCCWYRMGD